MAKKKRHSHAKPVPTHMPKPTTENSSLRRDVSLDAAAKHYLSGNIEEMRACLDAIEPSVAVLTPNERRRFDRLRALALAASNRLVDADAVASEGLTREPGGVDFLFVKAYVHLALKEFPEAAEVAGRCVECHPGADPAIDLTATAHGLSQAHNFVGAANLEMGESDRCRTALDAAIAADPGNHLPYLNLARLERTLGQRDAARRHLERGLDAARRVDELRLMHRSLTERPSVSACMIVKNEEELLPDCLASIRDWVDELIVVDTGSSDRTVEIAASFGARIFHQPWEGDFSKHRNYSIEQATRDWVFIIDADERFVVADLDRLREALADDRHQVVGINVFNRYRKSDHPATMNNSVRFFRRSLHLRYCGIVHNYLDIPDSIPIHRIAVSLDHVGYSLSDEKMEAKFQRTFDLLQQQLQQEPDNAFAWFNLAQLMRPRLISRPGEYDSRILAAAERAAALTDPADPRQRHIHLMALDQIAWVRFQRQELDTALDSLDKALQIKPDYLDALMLRGHTLARLNRPADARAAYEKYLKCQSLPETLADSEGLILYHPESRATAMYSLALLDLAVGDDDSARRQLSTLLAESPGYFDANLLLGRLNARRGHFEQARTCFERQFESGKRQVDSLLDLARLALHEEDAAEAEDRVTAAITTGIENADQLLAATQIWLALDRLYLAEELLESAEKQGIPAPPTALQLLGECHFVERRYEQAADWYQRLIAKAPDSAAAYNDAGNCQFKLGRYDQAEAMYRQALNVGTADPHVLRNLGVTLLEAGRVDEAAETFRRFLASSPDSVEIIDLLGKIAYGQEKFREAIEWYENLLRRQPDSTGALVALSECYLALGHKDSAIAGFRQVSRLDPGNRRAKERLDELHTGSLQG